MPDGHSDWSDDRLRGEFVRLSELPTEVAALRAEVAALRVSHEEAQARNSRIWTGILAFVVPVTLALITGGVEVVLHLSAKGH